MTKKSKPTYSIRGKLISAACMLLVAVIMVVSSTYAWFTLSTAPEVKGINTAVGANGALEMALYTGSEVLDSNGNMTGDINTYWGNLVDMSTGSYGIDKITLMPAALNAEDTTLFANMLKTPVYGADGRVQSLAANAGTATYDQTSFIDEGKFGFRAVGVASGMTDRDLAYRDAKLAGNAAMVQAQNAAKTSLQVNGSTLGSIAVKKALNDAPSFTYAEALSLNNIVNALLGTDTTTGVLDYIEKAYMQYILVFAAGETGGADDLVWQGVQSVVNADDATLESVITEFESNGITLPEQFDVPVDALAATRATVEEAQELIADLLAEGEEATYEWAEIRAPLELLAKPDNMLINDMTPSEVKDNLDVIVSAVTSGTLVVEMVTGGGVYADVADHCGNYSAPVDISIIPKDVGGFGSSTDPMMVTATMAVTTKVTPSAYLPAIQNVLPDMYVASGDAVEAQPLTEFYGYVLDLAFRTNAPESNLLLQTEATDRIYKDNANDETMGGGSSMTFKATLQNKGSDEMVQNLMENIRIVFFKPGATTSDSSEIVGYAKLNMENAVVDAVSGVTAPIYMYEAVETATYTRVTEDNLETGDVDESATETVVCYPVTTTADGATTTTYYSDAAHTTEDTYANNNAADLTFVAGTEDTWITETTDAIITALPQSEQIEVSALVYLDGNTITNADVAATVAKSMEGTMNLQFSSSANLVPMEYANLHTPNASADGGADAGDATNP